MQLRIEHLSKRYPNGVQALSDVSLAMDHGMFGLLGPNGAGKSTLMRILATLQDADDGQITLGEIDVRKDKDAVRRVLGYLPQEFGLYPRVTARELLDHIALLKGISQRSSRRALVEELLRRTNLLDAADRRLGGFSGGMKQRFGIAQALLGEPRLVIVDEPTAGLDPEERVRFHNLLSEIGEQVIVILSTHIVDDVSTLCRRMAVIHRGRVVTEGEPAALERTLDGKLWRRAVADEAKPAASDAQELLYRRRVDGKLWMYVYAEARPDEGFEPVEADLEDVYFRAIRAAERADPSAPATAAA